MNPYKCPVCSFELKSTNIKYEIKTLMELWKEMNVDFSENVITNLKSQTDYTELQLCPKCQIEVFYPILLGTPDFYTELQSKMKYYEDDKWDFHEAFKDAKGIKSILEIGCGPGNFLMKCIDNNIESYGTEYNQDAFNIALERGIKMLEIEELELKAGYFDAVFSFHVLEHVPDPIKFINSLIRLVKPGGKICISVPNQDGPLKYIDPCIMNMPPHHLTRWRLKTFKILAKELNLKIKKVSYEPLLLVNHYYYTYGWSDKYFSRKSKVSVMMKNMFIKYSSMFFGYLIKTKKYKYFNYLKGQAIYIVFEK